MPFLKMGMTVIVNGETGVISGISDMGLRVKITGDRNYSICFHPMWETAYLDEEGNIIADYRKNK